MRVLHITPTYAPMIGGLETVVDCLSRETVKHGVVADVVHVAPGLSYSEETLEDGRAIFRIPLLGHAFLGFAPNLRSIVRGYDILHVHDPQLLSITANVRIFCRGIPAVLSTHGGFRHTRKFSLAKQFHERFCLKRALGLYHSVLATSTNDETYFSSYSNNVVLAENGIDIGPHDSTPPTNRVVWNWLYWGRIARHKRVDLICDLAIKARSMGYPITLTICGSDFDGSLVKLQKRLGGSESEFIRYVGSPDDASLRHYIAEAGVYVTASEYEGFGLTILEAMINGLPVIARAISPIDGFVFRSTGLLLTFDGSSEEDTKLEAFLADMPQRAADISVAARRVANSYRWDKRVVSFLEKYRNVLDGAITLHNKSS